MAIPGQQTTFTPNPPGFKGFTLDGGSNVPFAGLNPAPGAGMFAYMNDGAAGLAWGANVTAGGQSTPYLLWYNGTNWTVVGK